ncbi:MAG: carbohydrate kinase family protein [bacterium]|nr:carbohydrate kinase family protein [bacterium]
MKVTNVYLYGMIAGSNSFLLKDGFLKEDEYSEIKEKYRFPGGETGTCATVLASLGANVKIDGTHIGYNVAPMLKEFYKDKSVDLSSVFFDEEYEGLEDYVIIANDTRTPMGTFASFYGDAYESGIRHWNKPKEEDIIDCNVAAIDEFFWDDSEYGARLCVKHNKPYVTIDCKYDSYIHQNASISVISGEGIQNNYPGKTREELFPLFQNNSKGLTIITNGGKEFCYGRKNGEIKHFKPYKVDVISTLGAGDTFKAGCTYALSQGMNDDEIVRFASACSAIAISRYPLHLNPPTLDEIIALIEKRKSV